MIDSVNVFMPDSGNTNTEISTKLDMDEHKWPIILYIAEVQIYLSKEVFIKLKNEILSLDRQIDERRNKCHNQQKT